LLKSLSLVLLLTLAFLTMFSLAPIQMAVAQNNPSQQVYLPISQLNFVGVQGINNLSRTLIVVGLTDQTVYVTLARTDLYDNSDGYVIPASLIQINSTKFSLTQSSEENIYVGISTSNASIGTYQGAIILTSTNTTTTTTTNIPITVFIEPTSASLTQQQVYLSNSQLNFVGEQGDKNLSRTIVAVGLTNQTVKAELAATELYDNASGKSIPANSVVIDPLNFSLSQSYQNITITIITENISSFALLPMTYQGNIILTTTNATATSVTSIPVTVKIGLPTFSSDQLGWILAVIVLIGVSLVVGEIEGIQRGIIKRFSKFIVVIAGISAVGIFFLLILSTSLVDTGNLIYTALISPFIAYLIYYVKNLRDERKSIETAARTVRNQNIGKDLESIQNLMGELTTHYVSFTSKIHKNDALTSDTWKKERKQGTASDLPLLRIEQYYSYITVYNYHYSLAVKAKLEETPVSQEFLNFKNTYAELEKLLFVNLEYDLGSLTALDLSPLQMEYPRITTTLLNVLNDSGVLQNLHKKKWLKRSKKREFNYIDLQKMSKQIYSGENTAKFLEYICEKFDDTYAELMELAKFLSPMVEPQVEIEKPEKPPQIKGTYTVDVNDLKKLLGKTDDAAAADNATKKPENK
jgi:hypothetical protein